MKIAMINTYSNGSTGTIAHSIGEFVGKKGHTIQYFYGRVKDENSNWNYIGEKKFNQFLSNAMTFITGRVGSFHISSTKKLIKELNSYQPDIIHLHNLHGNYLNFNLLFNYLKKFKGKVIITCHDEFLITGRCALCECDKWKTGCSKCKHLKAYPHALIDKSKYLQKKKQEQLREIKNLTIVTPSKWLNGLFDESLIGDLDCRCIHNSIQEPKIEEFDVSDLIDKNKINLLFAAFTWSPEKGALIINELCKKIDKTKYNIIIAGVESYCSHWFDSDCKKIGLIARANLLHLLKQVDIFCNPTFKDNFPTILLESIMVGTPSVTFDTGGCSEIIDESCGAVVKDKTCDGLLKAIEKISLNDDLKNNCLKKSKTFSLDVMGREYLSIYEEKAVEK